MRLIAFAREQGPGLGIVEPGGEEVRDLHAVRPELPRDLGGVLANGEEGLAALREAVETAGGSRKARLGRRDLEALAPIPRPARNVICVGKNYAAHAGELSGAAGAASGVDEEIPEYPIFFTKAPSAVIGPGAAIPAGRDETGSVDYEGEVAVILARGGRDLPAGEAWEHVFGLMLVNDVTSRALQRRHGQWFLGKSLDGFCPTGPEVVTPDELPPLPELRITTHVNGELRQSGSLGDLIFSIPELIESLSRRMTLEPGDIIATGTPRGVGVAFDPPRYLAPGDRVVVAASGLGELANPVA